MDKVYRSLELIQRKKGIKVVKKPTYWHIGEEKELSAGQVERKNRTAKSLVWRAPVKELPESLKRLVEREALGESECDLLISITDPCKAIHG